MSTPPSVPPPQGWYPSSPGQLQWWDGTRWTEHRHAVDTQIVAVAQPPAIRVAVKLMWISAALSLVSLVVAITRLDSDSFRADLRERMHNSSQPYSHSAYDFMYDTLIASLVLGITAQVGFWLWMAWKNSQGRNWARILVSVSSGIGFIFVPIALTSGHRTAVSVSFTIINTLITIAILVLLWRKESSDYYAAPAGHQTK